MIARMTLLSLATFITINTTAQEQEEPKESGTVNIGLCYPISTTGLHAPNTTNYFSANALMGISYNEKAFCGAGLTNVVKNNATGLIAAGFSNHIMNDARGFQAAGFANTIKSRAIGLQAAGFLNYSGSAKGLQMAGFANVTKGDMEGAQAAGFVNVSKDADAQFAGFMNVAQKNKVQFAGFINVSKNTNTQIAGFINVAKKVEGVQLAGFINIADSSEYPIGIINIVKNGEQNIGVTIDESMTTMVSFRSGGKKLYGILGIGANLQQRPTTLFGDGAWPFYALEGGLGAHIPIYRNFRLNLEGAATSISDFYIGYYLRSSLRVLPSITIGKHTEIFAGPTFNMENTNIGKGTGISTNSLWGTSLWNSMNGLYIGAMGGVAYKF